jgi:hypothetical protein
MISLEGIPHVGTRYLKWKILHAKEGETFLKIDFCPYEESAQGNRKVHFALASQHICQLSQVTLDMFHSISTFVSFGLPSNTAYGSALVPAQACRNKPSRTKRMQVELRIMISLVSCS